LALDWHPLLRINNQGKFRPQGWYHWVTMTDLVTRVGQRWQGRGTAFSTTIRFASPCSTSAAMAVNHQSFPISSKA
jgi:hypothetical protein